MSKAKKSNTQNGYILLSRNLEEWQWHDQPYMMSMLIHCLFKANYKDKMWQGIKIERGSFITSIRSLAEFTGMDSKTVQKCLKNLEESGTIKRETTNRYTKIIIVNYNDYQLNTVGNAPTQRPTQTPTQRPTRRPNNIIKERGCLTNRVRQPDFYAKKEGDFGEEVSKMVYNVVNKKQNHHKGLYNNEQKKSTGNTTKFRKSCRR